MLRPAQFHTLEEMDTLLLGVKDALLAARAAIDAYTAERLQWVSDNITEYREAMGTAYLDAGQVQNAIARIVDLTVLTFHPDRAKAAIAYGPQLDQIMEGLKLDNPPLRAAFEEPDPPPPIVEDEALAARGGEHHRRRH